MPLTAKGIPMSNRLLAALVIGAALFGTLLLVESARAGECHTVAGVEAEATKAGAGKFTPLSHEQLLFARGIFTATPPVSHYPPGEAAEIAKFPDGSAMVVFSDGARSCGRMGTSALVARMLLEIDQSI